VCSTSHRLLGTASFATTPAGYVKLLAWLVSFGLLDAVGIEGTGTYGAGLARFLTAESVPLIEVDRPDRAARRLHGKSDPVDAEAAARAVLSGRATGAPKTRTGVVEAIRTHQVVYRSAVKDRTAATNQFHALMLTAPDAIRTDLQPLTAKQRFERARRWRDRDNDDIVTRATGQALRELAGRIQLLVEQADRMEAELEVLTETAAPRRARRRGAHRRATAGHRRRQPPADPIRSRVRPPVRGRPHPRLIRQDQPSPHQPRRRPGRQQRTVADRVRAAHRRPTHQNLRRPSHR
jgi:hypothetical protein